MPRAREAPASKPTRLACETCSQRKVKCDKRAPCSNCHRSGAQCVPVERKRLPRGRQKVVSKEEVPTNNSVDLTDRPRNISGGSTSQVAESQRPDFGFNSPAHSAFGLCESAAPTPQGNDARPVITRSSNGVAAPGGDDPNDTGATERHLGGFSWTDIIAENDMPPHKVVTPNYPPDSLLLGFNAPANPDGLRATPATAEIRKQLCKIYLNQVDPVFKVLHGPSLREHLLGGKRYLNYSPGHPAVDALVSAVYYAAANSLSEAHCLSLFGASHAAVVTSYRTACEASLGHAGLVTTEDLTVLQAFIIFLVTMRSRDQSRRAWTLLSMAVRIAQALSLHLENPPYAVQPFEQEIRRRVWFAIGLLDIHASLDRAAEPMIPAAWLQSRLPANVNDNDLWLGFEGCLQDSAKFTDMTFTVMTCTAQFVARMLNFPPTAEAGATDWNVRQCHVDSFRKRAAILLQQCESDKIPFHWYAKHVGTCISASLQLLAFRPLRRLPNSTAPRVRPHSLLKLSVEVLKQAQNLIQDYRGHPWCWFEGIFVQWHALAVAITEISICEDMALTESCWPTVELAFDQLSSLVADSRQGIIWTPVEKLMRKAREKVRTSRLNIYAIGGQAADVNTTHLIRGVSADVHPHFQPLPSGGSQITDVAIEPVGNLNLAQLIDNPSAWPDVWEGVDLSDGSLHSISDMAWADWESLADNFNGGDEAMNMFPSYGYLA
ncbi:uncharacterized protein BP5553_00338 [Venustampulla echinocandica]|uniref:Zn(2)-C6 fungal-type domain-containing protein n=1 Tax=Venustampulla echinocandica TaxID=2656787 RepID=A0A370TXW1_9HELO|nr:uncharacterized protein BP5553_00338 [Venustampulla echinocandica]RDL40359.1 hypothetical protein BP5553_00338 [Venustampulla echinocandica]